jgi:hypothetical protein
MKLPSNITIVAPGHYMARDLRASSAQTENGILVCPEIVHLPVCGQALSPADLVAVAIDALNVDPVANAAALGHLGAAIAALRGEVAAPVKVKSGRKKKEETQPLLTDAPQSEGATEGTADDDADDADDDGDDDADGDLEGTLETTPKGDE